MSLIDEVKEEIRGGRAKCGVARLIEAHPEVADELAAALADRQLPGSAIARALAKRYGDDAPSDQMLNRHRSGTCKCP
jgi:hypothetical protein